MCEKAFVQKLFEQMLKSCYGKRIHLTLASLKIPVIVSQKIVVGDGKREKPGNSPNTVEPKEESSFT